MCPFDERFFVKIFGCVFRVRDFRADFEKKIFKFSGSFVLDFWHNDEYPFYVCGSGKQQQQQQQKTVSSDWKLSKIFDRL